MPDALPVTGLFGKVPAHGDFVRRGLPTSFVGPWDSWLQDGMATARDRLGARWAEVWDSAPPWRFALPAGACGPDAVAGVLLPSEDMVGRRFPITLAALLAPGDAMPEPAWFSALEAAALAGRAGRADADALAAAIPLPGAALPEVPGLAPQQADPPALPMTAAPEPDRFGVFGTAAAPHDAAQDARDAPAAAPSTDAALLSMATQDASLIVAATTPGGGVMPQPDAGPDLLDIFSAAAPVGTIAAPEPPAAEPMAEGLATILDLLGGAPLEPTMATPPAPDRVPSDGTLAFLLAEGGAPADDPPAMPAIPDGHLAFLVGGASDAPADAADQTDPLAALIAAGDAPLNAATPLPMEAAPDLAPSLPMPQLMSQLVPQLVPTDFDPLPVAAPAASPAAEAPAPPPGGGWWTGGGGRRSPSALSLPALVPTADFASLLEADA